MASEPFSVFHKISSLFSVASGFLVLASQEFTKLPAPQPGQSWFAWSLIGIPGILGAVAHFVDFKNK